MSRVETLLLKLCPKGVQFERTGTIAVIGTGRSDRNEATEDGAYPFYVRSKSVMRKDTFEFDEEAILVPGEGGIGEIFHYVTGKYALHQRAYRISFRDSRVDAKFAYYYFTAKFRAFILLRAVSATVTSIRKPMIEDFPLPLPPLEVQREIVRILDNFTALEAALEAELEARRNQRTHYLRQLLDFGSEIEWVSLAEVCSAIAAGGDVPAGHSKGQTRPSSDFPYPVFSNGTGDSALYGYASSYRIDSAAVTVSARGTIGHHSIRAPKFTPIIRLLTLVPDPERLYIRFLNQVLEVTEIGHSGGSIPQLTVPSVKAIRIPLPTLQEQHRIADVLDSFDALVNDLSIGLPAELAARRKQYEYYRDKLLTFEEAPA